MERCELCYRDDWHESHCPSNPAASPFPRVSAFAQAETRQAPLFKATFDQDGEPETLQMVASNRQDLEQINHDLNSVVEDIRLGNSEAALPQLESIQRTLYSLLR